MEEEVMKVVYVSELIQRSRPLTGASSLTSSRSIPLSKINRKTQPYDERSKSSFPTTSTTSDQSPNPRILKPLNHPTTLIGILTLPSGTNNSAPNQDRRCSNASCLQFSDDSATVCCDILDLDIRIIGQKISVLAWNFIPAKSGGGFLEIIRWIPAETFLTALNQCSSISNSIPLVVGSLVNESSVSRGYYVCGLLESVSPVSNIPCSFSGHNAGGPRNGCGFLTRILVCECEFCSSKGRESVSLGMNIGDKFHSFVKSKIVYFHGSASSWYTVISRLIGKLFSLSGLKKKLVYIGKEESQLTYVITNRTLLHLLKSPPTHCLQKQEVKIGRMGECCMYSGVITGIYMKGMAVELDQTVMLVLTDHLPSLPHSLRVGAIVSVRNVHLVYPTYSWTKVVILGSCFKTSILVKAFSPMENGFQQFLPSHSLLGKFIDSLAFSARLWVLLVVSSFKKKFVGILSEKVILGSKHTGLAQKYSSSCLSKSVFRFRHGVFTEYFKHESCGCGKEPIYSLPKLVAPISNFIGYCEANMQKMQWVKNSEIMGADNQYNIISCGGLSYEQPIRRILRSEDLNVVLLGCLKVSQYSGRLQLVDATGSIDIVIPDLPSDWSISDIYEIHDYTVILEGIHERMDYSESLVNESFSCRSIFSNFQLVGQRKFEINVYCYLRSSESRNRILWSSMDRKANSEELESGSFHLLLVTHKFPVLQKFPGDLVVSDRSSIYAEAVILPWNLFLCKENGVTWPTRICSVHQMDSIEPYVSSSYQEYVAHKRCKLDLASSETLISGFFDAGSDLFRHRKCFSGAGSSSYGEQDCCDFSSSYELACSITYRSMSGHCMASSGTLLHCTKSEMQVNSCCKMGAKKVLLEFGTDSLSKYELLRIGGLYMIKHHKEDVLCTTNGSNDIIDGKIVINSWTHLWSILFATNDVPLKIGQSCFCLNVSNKEVLPEKSHQLEIPSLKFINRCPKIYPDIYLNLSVDALSFFEAEFKVFEEAFIKPSTSLEEVVNSSQCTQIKMTASLQFTGSHDSDIHLPVGKLLSFHGQVLAVNKSDKGPLSAQVSHKSSYDVHQRQSCNEVTSNICIHVLVDYKIVRISSSLSTCAYPIGFGAGVKATFHRVLALRQDSLMLTPASFIVINSIMVVNDQHSVDCNDMLATSAMENAASLATVPAALISEVTQYLEHKLMQYSCKVVAVYVLVLEKKNEFLHSPSRNYSVLPLVNIPLAGFLMDDGSSLCCCWANGENATTLLRLNEGSRHEVSRKSLSEKRWIGRACNSTIGRMDKILKRHGRVTVKNYGSVLDSSCQDLTFSVASDCFVSSSDEEFLKFTILNACFSAIWNVAGTMMDSNAVSRLEKSLAKLDMTMLPLQNIWASEISHLNPIKEARNIVQEILRHD